MRTLRNSISLFILLMVTIFSSTLLPGIGNSYQGSSAGTKPEDATPIQEGRITDKQREHSKLYKGFGTGQNLKDLSVKIPGGVKVKRNTPLPVDESGLSPSFSDFLKGLACNADAVVIAVVKDKTSQLTEDSEFVFTDYELTIDDVLKDNVLAHLMPGISFTLTRPGGKVIFSGHLIEAEDASFKPLDTGQRYALFLKFISATRAYASLNSRSTYELRNNLVRAQTQEAVHPELNNEKASTFVEKLRCS